MFLYADSEDSDPTGQTPRLIRVFAGRKGNFVGFVMRHLSHYKATNTITAKRVDWIVR